MHRRLLKTISLCLILFPIFSIPSMAEPVSLAELRWQHRLIVAFSADGSEDDVPLRQWVQTNQCRLSDRDVIVLFVNEQGSQAITRESIELDAASVEALNNRRQYADESFEILLIGKDGDVKASSNNPVELDSFVALIDTMPMRRREAAQSKSAC
ncbi:MAG: DUF4174 domain-containing protein [Granulosicoccus sp.]